MWWLRLGEEKRKKERKNTNFILHSVQTLCCIRTGINTPFIQEISRRRRKDEANPVIEVHVSFGVLTWLGDRKGIQPVKTGVLLIPKGSIPINVEEEKKGEPTNPGPVKWPLQGALVSQDPAYSHVRLKYTTYLLCHDSIKSSRCYRKYLQ